jgi:hypothetical protein
MPASDWPLLFFVNRFFLPPPHRHNLPLPVRSLMSCRWRQHFLRNIRYAFARLHTFMTHRTVIWIFIAMKISCIFVLVFQAGQSVGWHFLGAAMNLKVFRTCTTSIIPAGQQFYFFSCTYCLVIYFHGSCSFVWCACPMAPVRAVTVRFSVISDTCLCRLFFFFFFSLPLYV